MTAPSEDAVGVAREKYTERVIANYEALRGESGIESEDAAWAEVIRAVRAECTAKVRDAECDCAASRVLHERTCSVFKEAP